MGVHDYSCVICGLGEQNLTTHPNCLGKHKLIIHEKELNEEGVYEDSSHHDSESGCDDGILICFELSSKINDRSRALELLKSKKAKNIRIMKPVYSWDSWDFLDNDEPMGYFNVLHSDDNSLFDESDNFVLPWKTSNKNRDFHPYKKNFWCMAFCYQCFGLFLNYKKIKSNELCSEYCSALAEANNIESKRKRKIYKYVREKYQWLRHIVRKINV